MRKVCEKKEINKINPSGKWYLDSVLGSRHASAGVTLSRPTDTKMTTPPGHVPLGFKSHTIVQEREMLW